MKTLSTQDMASIEGGAASLYDRIVNPTNSKPIVDPFMTNMKKMFGASAGRDLANVVKSIGLVDVINSIFGWKS